MKKILLTTLFLGGCAGLFAQDTTMNTVNQNARNVNATSYNDYGNNVANAPASFQSSFTKDYPAAANVTWQQSGDQWRASYNNGGRITNVYYALNGANYSVSLPVLNTYVPEELVSKAVNMHSGNLYSITIIKGAEGQNVLGVTMLDNGLSRIEFIGEDGAMVTNAFRADSGSAMDTMIDRNNKVDSIMMNRKRNGDIMNNNIPNKEDSLMRRDTTFGINNNIDDGVNATRNNINGSTIRATNTSGTNTNENGVMPPALQNKSATIPKVSGE